MVDELVRMSRTCAVSGVSDGPDLVAARHPISHRQSGGELSEVCVEPVAAVVAADPDPPPRVEGPPEPLDAAPQGRPHRGPGFGEDVVALVDAYLAPAAPFEPHPRRMPVVPEVDDGVPVRARHGEHHAPQPDGAFVSGSLVPRGGRPGNGKE